jgi:hypothetical protein
MAVERNGEIIRQWKILIDITWKPDPPRRADVTQAAPGDAGWISERDP